MPAARAAGVARPMPFPPPAAAAGAPHRPWLAWLQAALVVVAVLSYSSARLQIGTPDADELNASDPLGAVLPLLLLLGCAVSALLHWRRVLALLPRLWPFLPLMLLVLASALWSEAPAASLRRAVSLGVLMVFVLSTLAGPGLERFMALVVGTSLALILASLAEAALRPALGFDTGEYANAIRGVFRQKNVFGMALLCCALALSALVMERGRLRWRDGALLLLLLAMLVLARSTTSLLLTLLVAGATVAFLWLDRGGAWMAAVLLAATVGAMAGLLVFAALGVEGLFELLGKDSSLTGRTFIWAGVWAAIERKPLLGHGYAAFWLPDSPQVQAIRDIVQWNVPSAHSGYLEVLVQLGWVGGVLLAMMALGTLALALRALWHGPRRRGLWLLMLLLVIGIFNQSESALLNPDLPMAYWLMMLLAVQERSPRAVPVPAWRRAGYSARHPGGAPGAPPPLPPRR
ncbi:O-antigen ligase [Roseomonas sp. GC11]|uniref:O-antigen ligase family protein n=1 Tax=Roseomonas sp. GC11 TaxID=2950546 RepID=UPI00272EBC13|nr:O-antigen ligase family protein [Roseomonas sp. GC11]